MPKIKILYITGGELFDNRHRKLLSVVRNLSLSKYEFSVVCPGNILLLEKLESISDSIYAIDLPGRISSKYKNLMTKLQLGENFDIVHSFDYASGIYSRLLKKKFPGLICIHSSEPLDILDKERYLKRQVDKSTMQYLGQFTDRMIFENNSDEIMAVKNKYISRERTEVIPNSVNVSGFANLKKNQTLINELGLAESDFITGNISNFSDSSNQQILVRAAYYLSRKYPQMKFVFIGSGRKLNSIKELVIQSRLENHVFFINEKSNIADYYSIFDIFVLTDRYGGSSTILLEAMASQKTIICSKTGSYNFISKENITNLFFDPNNMDDLFWKIEDLYNQPEKRNIFAQNAMLEATQFDDTEIYPRIKSVYKKELSK